MTRDEMVEFLVQNFGYSAEELGYFTDEELQTTCEENEASLWGWWA